MLRLRNDKSANIVPEDASKNAHDAAIARRLIRALVIRRIGVEISVNSHDKTALFRRGMKIGVDDALVCSKEDISVNASREVC